MKASRKAMLEFSVNFVLWNLMRTSRKAQFEFSLKEHPIL